MAILDQQLVFSDAQAITATAASTNVIDFSGIRNLGVGTPIALVLTVTTAFTDASSDSTVTVTLESDDNSAFGSTAIIRTLTTFAALTAANTTRIFMLEPFTPTGNFERYMRLNYTVANGNLTTGAITGYLLLNPQLYRPYATGFVIA